MMDVSNEQHIIFYIYCKNIVNPLYSKVMTVLDDTQVLSKENKETLVSPYDITLIIGTYFIK